MKKILLLVLALLLFVPSALAEEADVAEICTYSLEEDSVLTVNLVSNPTTGYDWAYALSEEGFIAFQSDTYTPDKTEEEMLPGSGGVYTAVFETAMDQAGSVTLTFTYRQPWDQESAPAETITFSLWVTEAGTFTVESVTRTTVPFAE